MKKLLLIGVSGLLGSKIYQSNKDRYEIYGTYNFHKPKLINTLRLDVTERNDVSKLLNDIKPDLVIDAHALSNVDYCELHHEDAWKINVEGTKNVAEACKVNGCKYIFISTDYVYDGYKTTTYSEKDKPHPINYYGKTKFIAEKVIEALDMDYIIVRTAVLFGVSSSFGKLSFPSWVIQQLKLKNKIKVVIDQYSNPTLVDNLGEFLLYLYEKDRFGVFNISGKDNISRFEFSKMLAKEFNLDERLIEPITTAELNQPAKRPQKVSLNISKAEKASGVHALGLEEAIKIFKNQLQK
jgi:dTDP-4-dehydrorhamnose reductase